MSRGTRSLSIASKRLFLSFLKIFAAVFPDPTDRSWVSEDVVVVDQKWSTVLFLSHLSPSTRSGYYVAVHVIGFKVQDFNYSFFAIIFLPPSIQGVTSTDSIFDENVHAIVFENLQLNVRLFQKRFPAQARRRDIVVCKGQLIDALRS